MRYGSDFPHSIMFHFCHRLPDDRKGQGSIMVDDLERVINYVGTEHILSPEKWLEKVEHNRLEKNDICLSFDDGLKCQYDVAVPVLEKYDLKAFFFVYSSVFEGKIGKLDVYSYFRAGFFDDIDQFYGLFFDQILRRNIRFDKVDFDTYQEKTKAKFPFYSFNDLKFRYIRDEIGDPEMFESVMEHLIESQGLSIASIARDLWLTNADLCDLSDRGHCIGLHSYDHPATLCRLSAPQQKEQYEKNFDHIKSVTGKSVKAVAHPCNSYNGETLDLLKNMGVVCGFLSNMHLSNLYGKNSGSLEIAREDCTNILRRLNN